MFLNQLEIFITNIVILLFSIILFLLNNAVFLKLLKLFSGKIVINKKQVASPPDK